MYEWANKKMALAHFGAWYPAWPFEVLAIVLICCGRNHE